MTHNNWTIHPGHDEEAIIKYWINAEAGTPIADIRQHPNAEDHATLIAAAPALLAALESMIFHFDLGQGNTDDESRALAAARAAITQARSSKITQKPA